ncbi:hypothetical protein PROFUN_05634 [Planoprotostelium fungivorum]|uniref:Uncharacterized protein n=2 Tax=Planoprotostelium fungivorum TaxID=1890364 RepID=A0A2P6MUF2_9EUKA|nr:hypothetical protein PROFUN_05634 [Planoprotostelium fungivorum]
MAATKITDIFSHKNLDSTVLEYIVSISDSNNAEDIMDAECCDEAEAKQLTLQLLDALASSKTVNVRMSDDSNETKKSQLMFNDSALFGEKKGNRAGNTFEVATPSEQLIPPTQTDGRRLIDDFVEATRSEDPLARKAALRDLCPCQVLRNVPEFWDRIIAMAHDPDARVRYQVLHNLCDGSPKERENDVIKTIENMHDDEDKVIRRRAHQPRARLTLTRYSLFYLISQSPSARIFI